MLKKFFIGLVMLFTVMALSPATGFAEDVFKGVCDDPQAQSSTVCKSKNLNGQNPLFGPQGVLTTAVTIVSIIVGVVAVIMIIVGGFKLITSGSNPQDVTKARETILYAIVGLIIAALSQVLVQFFLKRIS